MLTSLLCIPVGVFACLGAILLSIGLLLRTPKAPSPPPERYRSATTPAPIRSAAPPLPSQTVVRNPRPSRAPSLPTPIPTPTRISIYDFPKCPLCRLRNIRGREQQIFSRSGGYRCSSGHLF